MPFIWLSIGSNIDREQNIRRAITALKRLFGTITLSPVYETVAVGFQGDPFYNLVAGCNTTLTPSDTSRSLKQIEIDQGRLQAQTKYSSRTIDIDLLTYDDLCIHEGGLQLPRAEILQYAFVLRPLADVAPHHLHPETRQSYGLLWQQFRGDRSLSLIDLKLN